MKNFITFKGEKNINFSSCLIFKLEINFSVFSANLEGNKSIKCSSYFLFLFFISTGQVWNLDFLLSKSNPLIVIFA